MDWIEISVNTGDGDTDALCGRLSLLGAEGFVVEDEAEFESFLGDSRAYWDFVDDSVRAALRGVSRVKFYVPDDESGRALLSSVRAALPEHDIFTAPVRDEDWENNWRQYYRPMEIGERLLVVPEWEAAPESAGRAVLRLDPGLSFGTGAHATTRMCLLELELTIHRGMSVLDLGCGSGILGIAALLLGAASALAVDIDPVAEKVTRENAALNGVPEGNYEVLVGNLLSDDALAARLAQKAYDVVCANIVASVIIALAPLVPRFLKDDGAFIASGIILERLEEVETALHENGLVTERSITSEGWAALKMKKRESRI